MLKHYDFWENFETMGEICKKILKKMNNYNLKAF